MEFHKTVSKVQHTPKGGPTVKVMFTVINRVLGIRPEPKTVFIRKNSEIEKSTAGF